MNNKAFGADVLHHALLRAFHENLDIYALPDGLDDCREVAQIGRILRGG